MDAHRFDTVSRLLASRRNRRDLVKSALGVLVGTGAVAVAQGGADALTCRPDSALCSRGNQCCSGVCEPPTADRLIRNRCRVTTCSTGAMRCTPGNAHQFDACDAGTWVTRACDPGTACVTVGNSIICGYPPG